MLKIHHLNCCSFCFPSSLLLTGKGKLFEGIDFVCHCLLIETNEGLVLVDTGIGLRDIKDPYKRLGVLFPTFIRPALRSYETAFYQIKRLGFSPEDVKHIILTHLDLDHAGGISDFPNAKVHVYNIEYNSAMERKSLLETKRYSPYQWEHNPNWEIYDYQGEKWFDFECVRNLRGLPDDILLIPLTGHTKGHCAIAVNSKNGWIVHAGDAYFYHTEMDYQNPHCPPLIHLAEVFIQENESKRLHNQEKLRNLIYEQNGNVNVFSAHDPHEYKKFLEFQY